MKSSPVYKLAWAAAASTCLLSSCTSMPTLVGLARQRAAGSKASASARNDVTIAYAIADRDVLSFTDEVKKKVLARASIHANIRYGAAGVEGTLGALAGSAKTFGWGLRTASGLGLGAAYVFGMGQIFDSKTHAQAYEQAHTAIQAAEATYYFHQLGMSVTTDATGKKIVVVPTGGNKGRGGVPSSSHLTPDGETLYYRTTKILKVLEDTLSAKIPDLQDLKEANGETAAAGSPAKPTATPAPAGQ